MGSWLNYKKAPDRQHCGQPARVSRDDIIECSLAHFRNADTEYGRRWRRLSCANQGLEHLRFSPGGGPPGEKLHQHH